MFARYSWHHVSGCLILALAAVGCGGKSISDLASSVKDAASQGVQSVQEKTQQAAEAVGAVADKASEVAQLAGTIKIQVDQPLETSACYVTFSPLSAASVGVLQLQSYRDAEQESFPSIFVRAQTSTTTLAELAGQTIAAQVFVQPQENGPLWTATDQPVQLKVASIDQGKLTAEIAGGNLVNSQTGASQAMAGTFEGMVQ